MWLSAQKKRANLRNCQGDQTADPCVRYTGVSHFSPPPVRTAGARSAWSRDVGSQDGERNLRWLYQDDSTRYK